MVSNQLTTNLSFFLIVDNDDGLPFTNSPLAHFSCHPLDAETYAQPRPRGCTQHAKPSYSPAGAAIEVTSRCHSCPTATSFNLPLPWYINTPNQDPSPLLPLSCHCPTPNQDVPRAPTNLAPPPRPTAVLRFLLRPPHLPVTLSLDFPQPAHVHRQCLIQCFSGFLL
ncbi:hypothetical protein EDB19DRAFT_1176054 [Suillus lakei]|nr:hypothetical protein EDB19DRAFT_1176054 [Suillus lakei]